eukprot:m.3155 g.3155  ORF g.3155 m.3155 type:complete len:85 (-) comp4616_c0_seq1:28-282(-)
MIVYSSSATQALHHGLVFGILRIQHLLLLVAHPQPTHTIDRLLVGQPLAAGLVFAVFSCIVLVCEFMFTSLSMMVVYGKHAETV